MRYQITINCKSADSVTVDDFRQIIIDIAAYMLDNIDTTVENLEEPPEPNHSAFYGGSTPQTVREQADLATQEKYGGFELGQGR